MNKYGDLWKKYDKLNLNYLIKEKQMRLENATLNKASNMNIQEHLKDLISYSLFYLQKEINEEKR